MAGTPPGPAGEPVFGSSRRYADDPFRFLSALEAAYGDVARFEMGPTPMTVVCAPSAIERVLVAEADSFRKPEFQDDGVTDLLGDGLLLSEGETWERQRDLANPAFSMQRLADMADRITDHAEARTDAWTPGDVVDVEEAMTQVTLDVILDLMLGVELSRDRVADIQAALQPVGERFRPNPIRFATPSWVPMPGDREFDVAVGDLEAVLDDVLARREGTAGEGAGTSAGDPPMDLLSILLRARDRGEQSADQLRDELMTVLLAGHDTTALTLTYTWVLLSEHPGAAARVHEEVDEVLDGDRPSMAHVREFDYLEWVIQEAMRLYPPVYTLFREPTEDVRLCGYEVPAGDPVMLPQWAVHRSERFYENPDRFEPERWRPERARERPRFAYFPFGGGPRHCIGKHLAMLEAKLIVAHVASTYRLDYLGETPVDLFPSLTAHPAADVLMRVEERE